MPRDPDLVYIPLRLLEDRRLTERDLQALFRLLTLVDASGRCGIGPEDLARALGLTARTIRRRLARLAGLGYLAVVEGRIELAAELVYRAGDEEIGAGAPLSDEEFARLQAGVEPGVARPAPGRRGAARGGRARSREGDRAGTDSPRRPSARR